MLTVYGAPLEAHISVLNLLGQSVLEVAPGTTVGGVWQTLLGEYPRLVPLGHSVGMAVNGKYTQPEVAVSDGDVVAFLPPVSGG